MLLNVWIKCYRMLQNVICHFGRLIQKALKIIQRGKKNEDVMNVSFVNSPGDRNYPSCAARYCSLGKIMEEIPLVQPRKQCGGFANVP